MIIIIIIKKHKNENLAEKHIGFNVSHTNAHWLYWLHFPHKYLWTNAKQVEKKTHKKLNWFDYMGKAHTLPEHGERLSTAEFWWVTSQQPWKGRNTGKDRGRV